MTKKTLFVLCLFMMGWWFSVSAKRQSDDSLRILWVGNSYTYFNDLPKMVQDLAASKHVKLATTRCLKGGERFAGHLKNEKLLHLLSEGGWDYVVLQEQSSLPAQSTKEVLEEVYPYAHRLDSLIHKGSPEAHVIFYQTWGHKYGNTNNEKTNYPYDDFYLGMQHRIITTYLEMTYQNKAWCAPVGMAWLKIRQEHPEYVLYNADCSHPSPLGSYLAANVIFTTIYQKPYQTSVTMGLDEAKAEVIQQTAQKTVLENLKWLGITTAP